jgi:hypothetical protein
MSAQWPTCSISGKTKISYPSAAKARRYARKGHDHHPDRTLRWYACKCGAWHLTSDRTHNERTT